MSKLIVKMLRISYLNLKTIKLFNKSLLINDESKRDCKWEICFIILGNIVNLNVN